MRMRILKSDTAWSGLSSSGFSHYSDHLDGVVLLLFCIWIVFVFYLWRVWSQLGSDLNKHSTSKESASGIKGQLFRYGTKQAQVAFQHGHFEKVLVFVGGLGDGLLSLPYTYALADGLKKHHWSLVQPLFSSSYEGFGTGSLDRDAAELKELFVYLKNERGCTEFVFMGHSTGCQDAVRFFKLYRYAKDIPKIAGAILQAGASDQEYQESRAGTKERIAAGKKLVEEGKEEEILFRDYDWGGVPMCARRYLALAERYGDDDTFSSYFTKEDFKRILGHMDGINCLNIFSGADQYVPKYVDKEQLCKNFVEAMGSKSSYYIVQGGDHCLTGKEEELKNLVIDFLSNID
eukprot:g2036.t1